MTLFALLALAAQAGPAVDLSKYDPSCGVRVSAAGRTLRAEWDGPGGGALSATFNLEPGRPLFERLMSEDRVLARDVRPLYVVTTGRRKEIPKDRPFERYVFFDKPSGNKQFPPQRHEAKLDLAGVRVESAGKRASVAFSKLTAGPFSGELVVHLYSGSPLLHVEAAMGLEERLVAYIYDFLLEGPFERYTWINLKDEFVSLKAGGADPGPLAVRHRAIAGHAERGCLAVFPPPHAFFFPRDHSDNFKFAQVRGRAFGLRQDPDQKNAFVPWFDAPPGRVQRMGAFVLLEPADAVAALGRVQRYTRNDSFKPLEGRLTMTSHWHCRLTVNELKGASRAAETVRAFKKLGVNIVHLAEFHGDGGHRPNDNGDKRLPELHAMFELCRKYSDDQLLLIPGEEANMQLNQPAPPGQHSGHWVYLFPKPVYLTLVRPEGKPFVEERPPYGTVYYPGNEQEMAEVLKREGALAWTAHPRIKASLACPDSYKDRDWYKSNMWLGGAWKAMPGDLSHPRLGVRVLDLLDDMNNWGQRKHVLGEVDCFEVDTTHELYGHMNVNYLRLAKMPAADDWSPVLDVLRRGDFFVTTGEVLIPTFEARDGKIRAELEWTFPLASVELVLSDGRTAVRKTLALPDATEHRRQRFEWPLEGNPLWVRLEAWDVASNGAFTQPLWLK